MTLAEATRQYQVALEHHMRAQRELGTTLSAADELAEADTELGLARREMEVAWMKTLDPSPTTP